MTNKTNILPLIKIVFFPTRKSWGKSLGFGAPFAHSHTHLMFLSDLVFLCLSNRSHGFSSDVVGLERVITGVAVHSPKEEVGRGQDVSY